MEIVHSLQQYRYYRNAGLHSEVLFVKVWKAILFTNQQPPGMINLSWLLMVKNLTMGAGCRRYRKFLQHMSTCHHHLVAHKGADQSWQP